MVGQRCLVHDCFVTQVTEAWSGFTRQVKSFECGSLVTGPSLYRHIDRGSVWEIRPLFTAPEADPRFPHTCPSCKRAAYIGLNQIEHQGGGPCAP